jgi:RNA polymerase sigma-70 factor (ECF subfamily)
MESDIRHVPGKGFARLAAPSPAGATMGDAVDSILIARIAAHDRAAMRILYARHHSRIRRFVRRFADDAAAVDDLLHGVFLAVWRRAGQFAGHAPVSTWLLAIARHEVVEAARAHAQPRDAEPIAAPSAP